MNYYWKRNIFHPVLSTAKTVVDFERVGTSGVIATEDAEVIELLDKVAKETPGAVKVIEKADYDRATEKKIPGIDTKVRRTFVDRPPSVDRGRSGRSDQKSGNTSTVPVAPAVAPATKVAGRPKRAAVVSAPTVEPPPGISGQLEPM